jgi:hypothetical protein
MLQQHMNQQETAAAGKTIQKEKPYKAPQGTNSIKSMIRSAATRF